MTTSTLPVRVRASFDPELGRLLWLVKWLLAIPHYLILLLLWPVFAVLTLAAFFAILFTGRYPRGIFEFNVGVLRWNWRVAYYTYGALGTDHYPPFTLDEVEDYPTHLEIEYPEHLSQGLVLVKWWLLAISHYLVVALFVGGGLRFANQTWSDQSWSDDPWVWNGGLIGVLTLVAALVLLVTGRYPRSVFDLLLGLNRWVLRVVAYSALMTDKYPPFRLDMGPDEPGLGELAVATRSTTDQVAGPTTATYAGTSAGTYGGTPVGPAGSPGSDGRRWSAGRIVTLVISGLLLVLSLGVGAGGAVLLVADNGLRDSQGFLMSGRQSLSSPGYAVTSDPMQLRDRSAGNFVSERIIGDVKVTANAGAGAAVFIGIAPVRDVANYLSGVQHSVLVDLPRSEGLSAVPEYREVAGGAPAMAPADSPIWAARSLGTGSQSVVWTVEPGDWAVVVMNAEASSQVNADVAVGATFPGIGLAAGVLLTIAGVLAVVAVVLMVLALSTGPQRSPALAGPAPGQPPAGEPVPGIPPLGNSAPETPSGGTGPAAGT